MMIFEMRNTIELVLMEQVLIWFFDGARSWCLSSMHNLILLISGLTLVKLCFLPDLFSCRPWLLPSAT